LFQSLNRAYKRSDEWIERRERCATQVSIPQSGLQAFRRVHCHPPLSRTSLFQSLNRAYKRSDRVLCHTEVIEACKFQSLNRAYKRSDRKISAIGALLRGVSIPQSGLQAFRLHTKGSDELSIQGFQSLNRAYKRSDSTCAVSPAPGCCRFNPSIGLTSVPTTRRPRWARQTCCFNPSIGLTSVPTLHCCEWR